MLELTDKGIEQIPQMRSAVSRGSCSGKKSNNTDLNPNALKHGCARQQPAF
ncbi:MAG: hypothetical protein IJH86_02575 [Clostridia bacterium]|nr:hypothetical protein [Clostridia bacterium]